jgi:hypothetical protein
MHRGVGICALFALCLAFADVASSGGVVTPFSFTACGSLAIAGEQMADPNDAFDSGLESCAKSCRKAAKQCEGYVKENASCQQRYATQAAGYGSQNCEALYPEDPELRRECKQVVKSDLEATKAVIHGKRENARDDCELWGITCVQACDPA